MMWTRESVYGRIARIEEWHTWFAWHPVSFEGGYNSIETRAWLETVERRKKYGHMESWWEYRKHDPILGLRNNDTQHGEPVR